MLPRNGVGAARGSETAGELDGFGRRCELGAPRVGLFPWGAREKAQRAWSSIGSVRARGRALPAQTVGELLKRLDNFGRQLELGASPPQGQGSSHRNDRELLKGSTGSSIPNSNLPGTGAGTSRKGSETGWRAREKILVGIWSWAHQG